MKVCQCHFIVVAGVMKLCQCPCVVVAALIAGVTTAACVVVIAGVLVVLVYRRRWVMWRSISQ